MRPQTGLAYISLAALCWGLLGPVGRIGMNNGLGPLEVAFWRAALAGVFFLLHAARTRALKPRSLADIGAFALFGLVSIACFFASYQYAVRFGGAALSSVLLYTAPAWVAVFSRLFFGERVTAGKLAAIGMALAGVICISLSGAGEPRPAGGALPLAGVLFGLLSGLLYATHYIFSKSYLTRYTAFTIYGWAMLFAALGLSPFPRSLPANPAAWASVLFLALVCTYSAYWAYCEAMKRLSPTRAAVLCTLEPVVATAASWWMWGENFTGAGWLGAALVIGAVFVAVAPPETSAGDRARKYP